MAEQSKNFELVVTTLSTLGNIAWALTDFARSEEIFHKVLPVARTIGNRKNEGATLGNLGVISIERGDYRQAKIYYEESLSVHQELGFKQGQAEHLVNLAELYHEQGDFREANQYYDRSLALAAEIGNERSVCRYQIKQAMIVHYQGDSDKALQTLHLMLDESKQREDMITQANAWTRIGHILLDINQWTDAADAYARGLTLERGFGETKQGIECLAGLAHSKLLLEEIDEAKGYLDELLVYLRANTLDGALEPARVYLACYRILQVVDRSNAQCILQQAYDHLMDRADKTVDADHRQSYLKNIPHHHIILTEYQRITGSPS